jgi:hypothetical protein
LLLLLFAAATQALHVDCSAAAAPGWLVPPDRHKLLKSDLKLPVRLSMSVLDRKIAPTAGLSASADVHSAGCCWLLYHLGHLEGTGVRA